MAANALNVGLADRPQLVDKAGRWTQILRLTLMLTLQVSRLEVVFGCQE